MTTSPCLHILVRGTFHVGGRIPLTSEVPEDDLQLLWLGGTPPVEVSSLVCLGTVLCLEDVEEAGHVGPNFLHQAVSDCGDGVLVTFQKALDESVVVSALEEKACMTVTHENWVKSGLSFGLYSANTSPHLVGPCKYK